RLRAGRRLLREKVPTPPRKAHPAIQWPSPWKAPSTRRWIAMISRAPIAGASSLSFSASCDACRRPARPTHPGTAVPMPGPPPGRGRAASAPPAPTLPRAALRVLSRSLVSHVRRLLTVAKARPFFPPPPPPPPPPLARHGYRPFFLFLLCNRNRFPAIPSLIN